MINYNFRKPFAAGTYANCRVIHLCAQTGLRERHATLYIRLCPNGAIALVPQIHKNTSTAHNYKVTWHTLIAKRQSMC